MSATGSPELITFFIFLIPLLFFFLYNISPPNFNESYNFAGFWLRLLALSLDSLFLLILGSAITYSILIFMGYDFSSDMGRDPVLDLVIATIMTLLQWLYYALMESSDHQATLGKKVVGIRVIDLHGNRIGFLRASSRHILKFLSFVVLFIGYFMAGFSKNKQALHDKFSGCLVVKNDSPLLVRKNNLAAINVRNKYADITQQNFIKATPEATGKISLKQEQDNPAANSEIFEKNNKNTFSLESHPNARLVLDYHPDAGRYFSKLRNLDEKLAEKFLMSIDKDPRQDVKSLYWRLANEREGNLDPFSDELANIAYRDALDISQEAGEEFMRAYTLLSDSMGPREIIKRVLEKFEKTTSENSTLNLYAGWDWDLLKAEWVGDEASILRQFEKMGYSANPELRMLSRPAVNGSFSRKDFLYKNIPELMALASSERDFLMKTCAPAKDVE